MSVRVRTALATVVAFGALSLLGCVMPSKPSDEEAKAEPTAADRCVALMKPARSSLPDKSLSITSATLNAASEAQPGDPQTRTPPRPAMPEHCEVLGQLRPHKGIDGQSYAIKFRLRLPTDWNGRFFYEGSGGGNGAVGLAAGQVFNSPETALGEGFAVFSQDSGHDAVGNADPDRQGQMAFGFDPQARRDYGYASYGVAANTAKALIKAFYGKPAQHSYFVGCSNGGREGMIFAQRYPDIFDGIVAAAPAFSLPKPVYPAVWDTQSFARLAGRMGQIDQNGLPAIYKTFSDKDLALVSETVVQACDGLDGTTDGMVQAFEQCTTERVSPALDAKICQAEKTDSCLTEDQVETLKQVYDGARKTDGTPLYATWPWDGGIGGKIGQYYYQGWRIWKLGTYDGRVPSIYVQLFGPGLSALVADPKPLHDDPATYLTFLLNYDLKQLTREIDATSETFKESPWDLLSAYSTDLAAFKARGGKLIVPHGVSDPVFSINDTIAWWKALNAKEGGHAADFVRVFPVPGMNHCNGGPATDQFDSLAAVVGWVEGGIAPDRINAAASPASLWPGRTRPLCPYPQMAVYRGEGSVEHATNFTCR